MPGIPGFTGESALSLTRRGFGVLRLPMSRLSSSVRAALMNAGGGGGSNFWCDPSDGTCSCLGGSLSDDCWLMQQYCTTKLDCSPYPPYKCTCSYLLVRSSHPIFQKPLGGVFTR